IDAHPHMTLFDHALANFELFLVNGDHLFLSASRAHPRLRSAIIPGCLSGTCARPAGLAPLSSMLVDIDRVEALKHLHHVIVLARGHLNDQHRMTASETLGIDMRVLVRYGVALNGGPIFQVAAVVEKLHATVVDAG